MLARGGGVGLGEGYGGVEDSGDEGFKAVGERGGCGIAMGGIGCNCPSHYVHRKIPVFFGVVPYCGD